MSCLFSTRTALLAVFCAAVTACQAPPEPGDGQSFEEVAETASAGSALTVVDIAREPVAGDVAHYTVVLRLGDAPSAEIALHRVVRERAAWSPRHTAHAIMLLHGDFATFSSNFLPPPVDPGEPSSRGLAGYLAERDIDVWGVDRRWTRTPADATDFSDYATMGLAEEIDDTERALAFARAFRALTGSGAGRMILGGFSHGAQIAYEVVGAETQEPPGQRHVDGLVPMDIYDRIAPEDEALRQAACESRDYEVSLLESGALVSDNGFFIWMGDLARSDPDGPSPLFAGYTNREVLLTFMGRTSLFYAPTPNYHLAGGVLSGNLVTATRYTPEARLQDWLSAAPPYQPMRESADLDAIWCGDGPRPVPDHLADIQVPLFYLGAAGGFGAHGLHTVGLVGSSDVTAHVVSVMDAEHESEDVGHGDLLLGDDAPSLAWQPLAAWIEDH